MNLGLVNLQGAKVSNIIGYQVEFPNGYPWRNGEPNSIKYVYEPLNIEKPPVPTLEELGLAQFWKENDFPQEQY